MLMTSEPCHSHATAESAQTMTTGVQWTENGTIQLTKLNKTNNTESTHKDKLIFTVDIFSS